MRILWVAPRPYSFSPPPDGTPHHPNPFILQATLRPGNYFGEVSLVRASAHTATVTAATPCVLLTFTKENFHDFFAHMPEMLAEFELKILGRNADLIHVLKHHLGHKLFADQLRDDYCDENLEFWDAVEELKTIQSQNVFNSRAMQIRDLYVDDAGDRQVNLKSENRKYVDTQFHCDADADISRDVFLSAQAEIYFLMENVCVNTTVTPPSPIDSTLSQT